MTSCDLNNFCWWGDKVETICPCQPVGKIILIIIGVMVLLTIIIEVIKKVRYNERVRILSEEEKKNLGKFLQKQKEPKK